MCTHNLGQILILQEEAAKSNKAVVSLYPVSQAWLTNQPLEKKKEKKNTHPPKVQVCSQINENDDRKL